MKKVKEPLRAFWVRWRWRQKFEGRSIIYIEWKNKTRSEQHSQIRQIRVDNTHTWDEKVWINTKRDCVIFIMIIEKRAGMKPAIYPRNSLFFSYLFTRILNLATSLPNFLSNYTKTFTKDNHTTWNPLRIIKMCRNLINYFGTIFTTVQFLIIVKVWYFLNKHLKYTKNL